MRCETTTYRGKTICKHSEYKYIHLAPLLGADIYFQLVQGAYSTSVGASAGTHALGGVVDQELDGYSFSQGRFCETTARNKADLIYYLRWWAGNHHGHIIDPECPNLAAEAASQVVLFGRNTDALVGDKPDTGDRTNVNRLMNLFSTRRGTVNRVRLMQRALGVAVDGVWGSTTDTALNKVRTTKVGPIKGIQTGLFVNPDGVWGPVTEKAYLALRSTAYKAPTVVKPAPAPVKPAPAPAPKPIQGAVYTGSKVIDVSRVRPRNRNEPCRRWNGLVWAWLCKNSPTYARANEALWLKEPADLFGTQGQRATQEMYRVLHKRYPTKFSTVGLPTWPGAAGVKAIGGTPV